MENGLAAEEYQNRQLSWSKVKVEWSDANGDNPPSPKAAGKMEDVGQVKTNPPEENYILCEYLK